MIDGIDRGLLDMEKAGSHMSFVDELFSGPAPDLENAICVAYLEDVFLGSQGDRFAMARELLSGRLKEALTDLEEHWARLGQDAQPKQTPA